MAANDIQIGGDHYKSKTGLEPWDVIARWNLGYLDGNALKYIARWRDKGGIDDLQKAIHYLEKLIEQETETIRDRQNEARQRQLNPVPYPEFFYEDKHLDEPLFQKTHRDTIWSL
jgi:hypothetical protein